MLGAFLYGLFGITVIVFIIYYLPLIAKDLKKITEQNHEIKELLVTLIKKIDERDKETK